MNICAMGIQKLVLITITVLAAWGTLRVAAGRRPAWRKALLWASAALAAAALYGILLYTMLGRTPQGASRFIWHSGSLRESFMNALLYVPMGVVLTELMDP
jgi:hypothetical protein